jgi:nucleoside-diphosphate-sugar epimerase
MQTILGANGVIANNLAKSLPQYTNKIRLVSRNPKKINDSDEIFSADLLSQKQVDDAVANSKVVYLTAGLKYNIDVWQDQWPRIIQNVITACEKANAKLVFFDNVYALGKVKGWMTEESPLKPSSKKGEVRAKLVTMVTDEVKKGNLQAIIARAADFYGPETPLGIANILVLDNLRKGRRAMWLVNANMKHSWTYTPDAGKATALLGNTPSAFNQTWNLPTDKNALTGKEFIALSTAEFGYKPRYLLLAKFMTKITGAFDGNIKELYEMLYQYQYDYLFDSSKFEKAFNFTPTSYQEGIKETVKSMR